MKSIWTWIRTTPTVLYPKTWHDSIVLRTGNWFGGFFWLWLAAAILLVAFQVWLLCEVAMPLYVRWLLAAIDLLATIALLTLAFVITSFGTHDLTAPTLLLNFFRRAFPGEYKAVGTAARLYRNPDVSDSQKRNVLEELATTPYSIRIFAKYVARVAAVVLVIPLYLGVTMLFLQTVPHQHLTDENASGGHGIHALEVIRDIQMGVLGGTSTEHLVPPTEFDSMGAGGWEVVLVFSTTLYLALVLVLLPMQIGIVGNLDRHLKSQAFWRRQLKTWPTS